MFPKGKSTSVPSDSQAKEKLANHVYEYLVHNGATKAAQSFLQEIHWDKPWQVGEPPGFLNQWWCVFYDLYSAAPERRESFEHSSEAKAFHDYGFVNSGYPNGLPRNPSIPSPISGGMPPAGGRPPSTQGIINPDSNIHTPVVSMQGGQMMVPAGSFFAPGHPMSNIGGQTIDMMRNRAAFHQSLRFQQGGAPMMAAYHPGGAMPPRHRFLGNSVPPIGIAHSPGPSNTPQGAGQQIMASPNDGLQNELQQSNSGGGPPDPFGGGPGGPNGGVPGAGGPGPGGVVGGGVGGSSRSPSHVISQPAPAFPPPPASETNSDPQSASVAAIMNGGGGVGGGGGGQSGGPPPQMPQFSTKQHQSHTMEYLPSSGMSFVDPPVSMKHSPQLHNPNQNAANGNGNGNNGGVNNNGNMNEVILGGGGGGGGGNGNSLSDFCNPMPPNGGGGPSFSSEHAMRAAAAAAAAAANQSSVPLGVQPISQLQMMQQGLGSHHVPLSMQSMSMGPSNAAQFISHPAGMPINASPQFPDYAFTSMSQVI